MGVGVTLSNDEGVTFEIPISAISQLLNNWENL